MEQIANHPPPYFIFSSTIPYVFNFADHLQTRHLQTISHIFLIFSIRPPPLRIPNGIALTMEAVHPYEKRTAHTFSEWSLFI